MIKLNLETNNEAEKRVLDYLENWEQIKSLKSGEDWDKFQGK